MKTIAVIVLVLSILMCGYAFALNIGLKPDMGISRKAFLTGEAAVNWRIVVGVANDYCLVGAADDYATVY